MGAKDTVMNDDRILKVCEKAVREGKHRPPELCLAQAEISFKAGIKEVVDTFHDDICGMAERFPTAKELTDFINKWQAELKEWGIKACG